MKTDGGFPSTGRGAGSLPAGVSKTSLFSVLIWGSFLITSNRCDEEMTYKSHDEAKKKRLTFDVSVMAAEEKKYLLQNGALEFYKCNVKACTAVTPCS